VGSGVNRSLMTTAQVPKTYSTVAWRWSLSSLPCRTWPSAAARCGRSVIIVAINHVVLGRSLKIH
jgi:hypothetical protein